MLENEKKKNKQIPKRTKPLLLPHNTVQQKQSLCHFPLYYATQWVLREAPRQTRQGTHTQLLKMVAK